MAVIKDGSGTGRQLRITAENRAAIDSVSRPISQHINEIYEKHFSISFEAVDPTGADDYFFYLKNTGTSNLHITKTRIKSTVTGTVEYHVVTGTASSGTAVTPLNRTIGSTTSLIITSEVDPDFTGLTNQGVLLRNTLSTVDRDFIDTHPAHIIIPPGQAVALLWDTATGVLAGTIDIYEDQGVN